MPTPTRPRVLQVTGEQDLLAALSGIPRHTPYTVSVARGPIVAHHRLAERPVDAVKIAERMTRALGMQLVAAVEPRHGCGMRSILASQGDRGITIREVERSADLLEGGPVEPERLAAKTPGNIAAAERCCWRKVGHECAPKGTIAVPLGGQS